MKAIIKNGELVKALSKTNKRSESLKRSHREHPEIWVQANIKSSITKNSLEGNKRLRDALEKCMPRIKQKLKGRIVWNKLSDDEKIHIRCRNCNKLMLVVPCFAESKKFCSRECTTVYKRGKPMLNWNLNSFHDKTGRGISGRYKGVLFRSSYELSFVVRCFQLGDKVVAEPTRIRVADHLSLVNKREFGIRDNQYYSPDYLLRDKTYVEIKPEKFLEPEHMDYQVIAKTIALKEYCRETDYDCTFLTEKDMGELMLTYKQIRNIPNEDIVFFKARHNELFKVGDN